MKKQEIAIRIGSLIFLPLLIALGFTACSSNSTTTPTASTATTTSASVAQLIATSTTASVTTKTKTMVSTTSTVVNSLKSSGSTVTIKGFITTEDDFASKLGADTSGMINMKMMAMSGLGITTQLANGSWEFYFIDGKISTGGMVNGKWAFDGTGAQMDAWNVVLNIAAKTPMAPVPVTITGVLKGDTMTNPGMDADGLYFPVITVTSIAQD